ncbi:MAG: hypothetical protein NVS3B27_14900 [Novosphingobium sp.]
MLPFVIIHEFGRGHVVAFLQEDQLLDHGLCSDRDRMGIGGMNPLAGKPDPPTDRGGDAIV